MKKLALLLFAALLSAGVYANKPNVSEKVLKAFNETFSNAENVSWHEVDGQYSVHFLQSDIRYIVYYNKRGSIISSMRYYKPCLLPTNVLSIIKQQYPGMKPFGVTEITSGGNMAYFIKVEDGNFWYTIKADSYGGSEVYEKLKMQH